MLRCPHKHEQFFAPMFGQFTWEKHEDLTPTGAPTKEAIPALKQHYLDLSSAIPESTGFSAQENNWQNRILAEEHRFAHVLTHKDRTCKAYQAHPDTSLPPIAEDGFVIDTVGFEDFPCPTCGKVPN